MTTIAYRDGVLAGDSLVTDDSCSFQVRKVVKLPKGDIAGGAGDMAQVAAALSWLAGGSKGDAPSLSEASILFTDGGVPFLAASGWPGMQVKGFAAIGSGAQGALVAMRLGKSAEDAVAAVAGIDHCTGGEIDVLTYERPRARKS